MKDYNLKVTNFEKCHDIFITKSPVMEICENCIIV